jgi:uncharacterized DUF497 family protein
MYNLDINFEYDERKSQSNQKKHGVSFEEAKKLWVVLAVEIQARTEDETRCLRIGKLNDKLYSCVFTMRGDVVRLISVRRSRQEEEKIYAEKINEETREENQSE